MGQASRGPRARGLRGAGQQAEVERARAERGQIGLEGGGAGAAAKVQLQTAPRQALDQRGIVLLAEAAAAGAVQRREHDALGLAFAFA